MIGTSLAPHVAFVLRLRDGILQAVMRLFFIFSVSLSCIYAVLFDLSTSVASSYKSPCQRITALVSHNRTRVRSQAPLAPLHPSRSPHTRVILSLLFQYLTTKPGPTIPPCLLLPSLGCFLSFTISEPGYQVWIVPFSLQSSIPSCPPPPPLVH